MSDQPQLIIEYPTTWVYKIIGSDDTQLRAVAAEVVGHRSHETELSNTSASGRYVSLTLRVLVEDEVSRLSIFERLKAAEEVRLVL